MTKIGIHVFRRDLRISDNVALNLLSKQVSAIIPIFIFDPFQIDITKENVYYRSEPAIKFMLEALEDLDLYIQKYDSKLRYFYGKPHETLKKILRCLFTHGHKYEDIYVSFNADYSKYSLERDEKLIETIKNIGSNIIVFENDLTLGNMEEYLNENNAEQQNGQRKNKPYMVFSSFLENAMKVKRRELIGKTTKFIENKSCSFLKKIEGYLQEIPDNLIQRDVSIDIKGGRKYAVKIFKELIKNKGNLGDRDNVNNKQTGISPYMKFGCISILETYIIFKKIGNQELMKQLYWRQYFFVLSRYKHNDYKTAVDPFFDNVQWKNDIGEAKALWDKGMTGFPIVDACIRELQQTGQMHNRGRLIVSNFAIKILHQNPFWDKYGGQCVFSRYLYDCCYANNYGNWNFALGPYDIGGYRFGKKGTKSGRIINVTKFKKWDPELQFIRKYLPELNEIDDKYVFNWNKYHQKILQEKQVKYCSPIVDFEERKKEWYKLTKN